MDRAQLHGDPPEDVFGLISQSARELVAERGQPRAHGLDVRAAKIRVRLIAALRVVLAGEAPKLIHVDPGDVTDAIEDSQTPGRRTGSPST